jgi:excisionase family DNA binding protein
MGRRSCPSAPAPALEAQALDALAGLLAPRVARLLANDRFEGKLVDVAEAVPVSRRVLYRACRAGRIAGAVRVGRRWLAARDALDAWLRSCGPRAVAASDPDDSDDLEPLRRRLLSRVAR